MGRSATSEGSGAAGRMTSERLGHLLSAYGANPDRWPPEEKEAALALLEASTEARAERDRAAHLDALLDRAPTQQPSPEFTARVLAAASAREIRSTRRPALVGPGIRAGGRSTDGAQTRLWRYLAAAAPLAAAAGLVLWLTQPPSLPPGQSAQLTIGEFGAYETPMDVLLDPPVFDLVGTVPSLGCADSGLGCPELDLPPETKSRTTLTRRTYA